MLGKQWLNRYLRDTGGSIVERCGDRQRKRNGIERWPFEMIVGSLPVMLQIALLLLGVGLSRYMRVVNISVAHTILGLTAFGVAFFILIVVAGTSSYECPFQTPASLALRALGVHRTFGRLASFLGVRHLLCNISRNLGLFASRIKRIISEIIRRYVALAHMARHPVLPHQISPRYPTTPAYLSQRGQDPIFSRRTDRTDARCINWIFSRISTPKAIDSALRLACTIRWYHNGVDPRPSSDAFDFVLRRCFEHGKVRPGRRDRAYNSARVISRLYVLAWARSDDLADTRRPLPPPPEWVQNAYGDHDLCSTLGLLSVFSHRGEPLLWESHFAEISTAHAIWVSDLLLYLECAMRDIRDRILFLPALLLRQDIPLSATAIANILVTACITLGWPVNEELLYVDDKSCVTRKPPPYFP
jgi:hypothetical protein